MYRGPAFLTRRPCLAFWESAVLPLLSDHTTIRDRVLSKKLLKTSNPITPTTKPQMEMTLAARNKAPAMDKLSTDELATDELAKNEPVTIGLATDELATDALPHLLASKPTFVAQVDWEPPKETKSITSSLGTTTIPWWLKAFRQTSHDRPLSASVAWALVHAHVWPNAECFVV